MALSLRRYRKMLLASGLIELADLRAFERSLAASQRPATADDLSRRLVEAEKLTQFQAAEIQAGRGSALVLGNYVVLDRIGAGGMGQVFKAWHKRMQRLAALKTLPDQRGAGEDSIARFHREILSAAQLSHPNIVAAYDADMAQGIHFLVMEYVDGPNLAEVVRHRGPLPPELAVRYVLDAARGLSYAHERGIVHRDVKPSNLIVSPSGTVKVLDLGLARSAVPAAGTELTMAGDVVGTLEYMAPEQAAGAPGIDRRADIYGLGCTLYRLITGELPYRGATASALIAAHRQEKIPSLKASRDGIPRSLDNVFKRMVAKQPSERLQTMDDVIGALERLRLIERRPTDEKSSGASLLGDPRDGAQAAAAGMNSAAGDEGSGDDLMLVSAGPVVFQPVNGCENEELRPSPDSGRGVGAPEKVTPPVSPLVALVALVAALLGITGLTWLDSRPKSESSDVQRHEAAISAAPRELARRWSESLGLPVALTNSLGMRFVLIPPTDDPEDGATDPVQTPFYYGACELTVAQFRHFMEVTGYRMGQGGGSLIRVGLAQGDRHPAVNLTAADAEAFCRWLSQVESAIYRLPTQAEWAHACRAGSPGKCWFDDDPAKIDRYAWYQSNSAARTHQVGLLEVNPFGLHDLVGNAAEWCVVGDPVSNSGGHSPSASRYVLCGGCWSSPVTALGPVDAGHAMATGGLRLVLELPIEARWPRRSAAVQDRSKR